MLRYICNACLLLALVVSGHSQDKEIAYTQINLSNLDAFKTTGTNWRISGDVFYDHMPAGKTGIREGAGILVNDLSGKDKGHLFTKMQHGDIEIELDFMMDKN